MRRPSLTRRGTRKKKLEIVQLWRCASASATFTPGPAGSPQQDLSAAHDPLGANRLRHRLYARRNRCPSQEEDPPQRLAVDDRVVAGAIQAPLQLSPPPRDKASPAFPRPRPSARSSSTIAKSIASPTIARSSTSCARERSTTSAKATSASRRSPNFSNTCRRIVRTNSSAGKGTPKPAPLRPQATFADAAPCHRQHQGERSDRNRRAHHPGGRQ